MSRILEKQFYGTEPTWDTIPTDQIGLDCLFGRCYNWYSSNATDEDRKNWLLDYMKAKDYSKEDIRAIREVKNVKIGYGEIPGCIGLDPGIVARMDMLGAPLRDSEKKVLERGMKFLLSRKRAAPIIEDGIKEPTKKVDVQKRIEDVASKYMEEVEATCDRILTSKPHAAPVAAGDSQRALEASIKAMTTKAKRTNTAVITATQTDPVKEFVKNVNPIYCAKIAKHCQTVLEEISKVIDGVDPDLIEGYSCYSKTAIKEYFTYLDTLIKECESKVKLEKSNKVVVRRKRRISPYDAVKKLSFKKEDTVLKLQSISPSKIIEAQKLVVYNTKYRTVSIFEADGPQGLYVKGTTVIQFDLTKSKTKKLRKPEKFFAEIKDKGIRAVKNAFDSIKGKEKPAKGRINDEVILYGVY